MRRALGERLLVAEAGEVAQHVVQRHQRKAERETAEREAQQLQREFPVVSARAAWPSSALP